MTDFFLRDAKPGDAASIRLLLHELAGFENLAAQFRLTEADVARDMLCDAPLLRCVLALADAAPAGLVTWYGTYASFAAARGAYIEDLYVRPQFRGAGLGKRLIAAAAGRAKAAGAARIDWAVLDWNAGAIAFYESLGAKPVREWRVYRLGGDALDALA